MALRNLRSDLTQLRFSKDTPGGGYSGQPYIKISSPEYSTAIDRIATESARFSQDFPVRGGLYSVRAVAEDAIRIRKFLTDFPKGPNFTFKQVGLQKSNPLIQTGRNGGRINTRTYNLNANLQTQILSSNTGIHYPRAGATPFTLTEEDNLYLSIVGKGETEDNRLVNLFKSKISKEETSFGAINNLGISLDDHLLFEYTGGPNSFYGDGETVIFRATDHQNAPIDTSRVKENIIKLSEPLTPNVLGHSKFSLEFLNPNISEDEEKRLQGIYTEEGEVIDQVSDVFREKNSFKRFASSMNYDKIIALEQYNIGETVTDFRSEVEEPSFSRNYQDPLINIKSRVGIGSPGARPRSSRNNINTVFPDGQDKVNLIPIVYKNYSEAPEEEVDSRDLIKFNFETIDNNNPDYTTRTHFRAFLKSLGDSHNADWASFKYAGRGEDMFVYQGFGRTVSFSFMMAAQSKQEMKPLYQKLNYLTSTITPDYSPDNGFMRGNITRLTIGEYLYRVPGVLVSLNYNVEENFPWEIKMDQPENGFDKDQMELPQVLMITCEFKPILDVLPRTGVNTPLIMSNKVNRNFLTNVEVRT